MVQSITVAFVASEETSYILDGHHRLRAFSVLAQQGLPTSEVVVPVVQYYVDTIEEMMNYYMRINKHMPIHPLERQITYADYEKVLIEYIIKTFALYIKDHNKSVKCPHISLCDLKRNIHARQIGHQLQQYQISIDMFWSHIMSLNQYITQHLTHTQLDATMNKRIKDCQNKTAGTTAIVCFLPIWRHFEWLDICMTSLLRNIPIDILVQNMIANQSKRRKIPAIARQSVWKKVNASLSDVGECCVCGNDLNFNDMECAHITAHALGGEDTVDNLMPTCKTCNRDMGIMNLYEYKKMVDSFMSH